MAIIISNTIQKKELGKGKISESDKAVLKRTARLELVSPIKGEGCLLYTSDAADEL